MRARERENRKKWLITRETRMCVSVCSIISAVRGRARAAAMTDLQMIARRELARLAHGHGQLGDRKSAARGKNTQTGACMGRDGRPMATCNLNSVSGERTRVRTRRWRHSTLSPLCVYKVSAQRRQHRSVGHRLADELSVGEHAALELEAETGAGTA